MRWEIITVVFTNTEVVSALEAAFLQNSLHLKFPRDNLALLPSWPLAAARGDVQMVCRFDFVLHCRSWLVYFMLFYFR